MKRRDILAFSCGFVATCLLTSGRELVTSSPGLSQTNTTLLISAAASLTDALEEIAPLYQRANPSVRINYNFGASGALQQQIVNGAPADIFFSAAARQMDALQQGNLILNDTRQNVLTNRLVLIVPSNSTLGLTSFRQLAEQRVRRIAIGEPRSVPVGQYTQELFSNLGLLNQLRSKFVLGNNVRNVLAAVESGNADAGVVYTTDARISGQVRQVATAPENLHSPIVYPIAVLRDSRNAAAARRFVQFLTSRQAAAVFQRYGFGIAR